MSFKRKLEHLFRNINYDDFIREATLEDVKQLIKMDISHNYSNMFISVCKCEKIEIIEFLLKNYEIDRQIVCGRFEIFCEHNKIELVEFLLKNYEIDRKIVHDCFKNSCENNKMAMAQILFNNFKIDRDMVNRCFYRACHGEHVDMIKWLMLVGAELSYNDYQVLKWSYRTKDIKIWLLEIYISSRHVYTIDDCFKRDFYEKHKLKCDILLKEVNDQPFENTSEYKIAKQNIEKSKNTFNNFLIFFIKELQNDLLFEPMLIKELHTFLFNK